jgi:hypothetical protein
MMDGEQPLGPHRLTLEMLAREIARRRSDLEVEEAAGPLSGERLFSGERLRDLLTLAEAERWFAIMMRERGDQ